VTSDMRALCRYSAPEICLTKGNYNSKVDVFAVGCVLAELLFCCDSANFFRLPGQDGEYLKRRWLFPARLQVDLSRQKPFLQIVPILKHAVFDKEDIQHPHPGRAVLTKAACDRLSDERFAGFDSAAMQQCHMQAFEFQDLSDRFRDPSNLDADELSIFVQLRDVLKECLAFDPSRRCSSRQALEMLTGERHQYSTMPMQALEDIKSVELAVQYVDSDSLERRRKFIKHCPPLGQSTPVSELLGLGN
jgi:serine/threonine protein kinase